MRREYPHRPAAFINAIAEEGTKAEAVEWLQKTWNELCAIRDEYQQVLNGALVPEETAWIPVRKDDQRFARGAYVPFDAQYVTTVRSNGESYDHFVMPLPSQLPQSEPGNG